MSGPSPARDDVFANLRLEDVADHYNLCTRTDRATARLSVCPSCEATSSSKAIVLNFRKQTWGHFGNGKHEGGPCFGNALDLVAACERLDRRREFPKVLAIAAGIAGIPANDVDDAERERRKSERVAREAKRQRRAVEEDARAQQAARWLAAGAWHRMIRNRRSAAGERYLRARGLNPSPMIDGDYIRFDIFGNVCVPLYDLVGGDLVNVVRRRIDGSEPKTPGLKDCPNRGTLSGRVQEITSSSTIVAEGVIDTLTAIQRWPGRLVLGAHGAGQLRSICEAASPRVRDVGGKLVLIPDGDDVGKRQAIRAGESALKAGLVMDQTLLVVEVAPHHDLNEAHCKGWTL